MFKDLFGCQLDIEHEFGLTPGSLDGANVLFAHYSYVCYTGQAFVLYREGGKLYAVHGSHCSCYGLDGQWEPEELSREEFNHFLNEGYGYPWGELREELYSIYKTIEEVKVKRVVYFEASDGKRFESEADCVKHEVVLDVVGDLVGSKLVSKKVAQHVAQWLVDNYTLTKIEVFE